MVKYAEVFLKITKHHTQVGGLLCLESTWTGGGGQEAPSPVPGPPVQYQAQVVRTVDPIPFRLDRHSSPPPPPPPRPSALGLTCGSP